jgi:holliday junction DNA helicase RuvB
MAIIEDFNPDNLVSPKKDKKTDAKQLVQSLGTNEVEEKNESLRAKNLSEIIGRESEKRKLNVLMQSAKSRNDVIDHILFYGPPGLGKTTFGQALASEFGTNFIFTSGPGVSSKAELASICSSLNYGDFLFIDEIHRLNKVLEEFLYPILEDFQMDVSLGKGTLAKVIKLDVPKFTLIGATTQIGLISSPLRDRFGMTFKLDFFSLKELTEIVIDYARKVDIAIDLKGAKEIATRSRGTARIAIKYLRRARDYAFAHEKKSIDFETVIRMFEALEVDELGLDGVMRKYIEVLIHNFNGGPVGLSNIAASIYEDIRTIEEVYEPYLIKIGFLKRTVQGRVVTDKCYEYYEVENKK